VDSAGSGWGLVAESSDHGNEPSVSIKGAEFLVYLSTVSVSGRTLLHGVSCHWPAKSHF
jgi:hypothetical protein